jgi:phosphatidate cytidylyltransferase
MLRYRLPSGLIMVGGLLTAIWADNALARWDMLRPGMVLFGLTLIIIGFMSYELAALLRAKWGHCRATTLWWSGAIGCGMTYLLPQVNLPRTATAGFATGVAVVLFAAMFRHSFAKKQTHGASAAGASAMFALVYLGVLPGMYLLIRVGGYSAWVIAAVLLVVKACDVGAYFTGRLIGRHKLIPWLSPGKTWEGLIGGMVLSAIIAVLFTWWGNHRDPAHAIALWWAIPSGLILGLLGQVGDLVASLMKRDAGIKDWARTIPGFGGVMDVGDSLLLIGPVAYWLLLRAPAG